MWLLRLFRRQLRIEGVEFGVQEITVKGLA